MGRLFLLFLLVLAIVCGIFFIKNDQNIRIFSSSDKIQAKSEIKEIKNNWFPVKSENWQSKNSQDLSINAKGAIVMNYETGEILYAKDAQVKLPAASTVKIMSAIVALDHKNLTDTFSVSEKASEIGENSMRLERGERLTLEELLYGMMLVSGNDAVITVAEGTAGTQEEFVRLMNEKAGSLGLLDTKFVNATGLDNDNQKQYTTVYDMATLAHYAWENYPEIRKIASTYEKYIEATDTHKDFLLYNDTNLLTTYPGVKGIKPGFTWDARWCLVTYAENDDKKLLGVILGSEDRRGEMVQLLDYGFGKYGIRVDHPGLDL